MKRKTHLIMGAAAAVPVAITLSPVGAVASIWFGVAGGALPDYIDLRSEARRSLRHRGVSHSVFMIAFLCGFSWIVLDALSRIPIELLPVPVTYVTPWTIALGFGIGSHLLGDACTRAGIQPLLPLLRWQFWLLPRFLRGRSEGRLNALAIAISTIVLGFGIAGYMMSY